jgi:hypothetical protein
MRRPARALALIALVAGLATAEKTSCSTREPKYGAMIAVGAVDGAQLGSSSAKVGLRAGRATSWL